jgi:hypothetical protein
LLFFITDNIFKMFPKVYCLTATLFKLFQIAKWRLETQNLALSAPLISDADPPTLGESKAQDETHDCRGH